MSALHKKLRRDLLRMKGQVVTIALVLACGIFAMLMLRSTYTSLLVARDTYYAEHRFADVFAQVQRAPEHIAARLESLPGVARAETRIVEDVMVPLPDEPDPITGRIVSLPEHGVALMNAVYLRSGRPPAGLDEAVILEQFAIAHGLHAGDRLPVVMNGQLRRLVIVGIALSPEYVLAVSGGAGMVDNRAFVVIWMQRSAVAPTFQLEGAFNNVSLQLEPGAQEEEVLAAIDRELAPYGGFHAVPRSRQMSNWALTGELDNLRNLALVIPAIFLAVAAFLVNVVVSRLVFLDRTQIAVLKALGYADRRIAMHYLELVAAIVGIGAVLGIFLGWLTGGWMTDLFAEFYKFPEALHGMSPGLVAGTVAVGLVAAVAGALVAVRRVVKLPPAQAMRPPTPLTYRRSLVERLHLQPVFGASSMMVVREIERKPFRFLLSTAGIAMAVAIYIFGTFSWDSFEYLMDETFLREHREDMSVTLSVAKPVESLEELATLPGVRQVEGQRTVPVRVRAGARWRDSAITGYPRQPVLNHPLSGGTHRIDLSVDGVILTDRLAKALDVRVGDSVEVEILEGDWRVRTVPVAGLIDEPFGLRMHARRDWLDQLLDSEPRVNGILLSVDAEHRDELRARLKEMPAVVGVISTQRIMDNYRAQTGESMLTMTLILALSGAAIAIGIVYNNARIALSMRSRDLATLRVLGFTRREISSVLLGELGVQVLLGIPLGLALGTLWAKAYVAKLSQELMSFPLHIQPSTYAMSAAIALVAGAVSALLVRRKLDRLDLVGVLKSSE